MENWSPPATSILSILTALSLLLKTIKRLVVLPILEKTVSNKTVSLEKLNLIPGSVEIISSSGSQPTIPANNKNQTRLRMGRY